MIFLHGECNYLQLLCDTSHAGKLASFLCKYSLSKKLIQSSCFENRWKFRYFCSFLVVRWRHFFLSATTSHQRPPCQPATTRVVAYGRFRYKIVFSRSFFNSFDNKTAKARGVYTILYWTSSTTGNPSIHSRAFYHRKPNTKTAAWYVLTIASSDMVGLPVLQ